MSRSKITTHMIKYLEDRLNCDNIIKFVDNSKDDTNVNKLIVDKNPVAFEIEIYDEDKDKAKIKNKFAIYDFITESNYTGFTYFPYLYGVLNCHAGSDSHLYTFYEAFDGDLTQLVNQIEHPSEWYDIAFQLIILNYYMQVVSGYAYGKATPSNHLYRKLPKPYNEDYTFAEYKFRLNRKFLIVLWNIDFMEKIKENESKPISNLSLLLKYLEEAKDKISIYPSPRILSLLHDVDNNVTSTIKILDEYYNRKDVK